MPWLVTSSLIFTLTSPTPASAPPTSKAKSNSSTKRNSQTLALQETRLLRRRKLETEALEKLQAPRKEAEAARKDMAEAVELYLEADKVRNRFVPQLFGFEFTEIEVEEEFDKLVLKNNMIGKANGLSEKAYEQSYWRFCGKYDKNSASRAEAA